MSLDISNYYFYMPPIELMSLVILASLPSDTLAEHTDAYVEAIMAVPYGHWTAEAADAVLVCMNELLEEWELAPDARVRLCAVRARLRAIAETECWELPNA